MDYLEIAILLEDWQSNSLYVYLEISPIILNGAYSQ